MLIGVFRGEMIEAKIGAWTEMSILSGSDCIVVKQESVIFPNVIIILRLDGNLWQRFPECQHGCVCSDETKVCQSECAELNVLLVLYKPSQT